MAFAAALVIGRTGLGSSLFRTINAWPETTGDLPWALTNLLGEGSFLLVLGAVVVVRRPARMPGLLLASLLFLVLLTAAKELFDLPRPIHVLGDGVRVIGKRLGQESFPSGHAGVAFLSARALLEGSPTRWRRGLVLGAAVLAALARVAVGAHWPEDMLAGAALGWGCGEVGLALASGRRLPRLDPVRVKRWTTGLAVVLLGLALALASRDRGDGVRLVRVALVLSGAGLLAIAPPRRTEAAPRDGRRGLAPASIESLTRRSRTSRRRRRTSRARR